MTFRVKHGHSLNGKSGSYRSWKSMRQRCNNPKDTHFKWYGARGIRVCQRWDMFENFLEDMGDRPIGKSLDRINTDSNYYPENCRWATQKQQMRNYRNNWVVSIRGSRMALCDAAEAIGLPYTNLWYKLKRRGFTSADVVDLDTVDLGKCYSRNTRPDLQKTSRCERRAEEC